MNSVKSKTFSIKIIILFFLIPFTQSAFSQRIDSTQTINYFGGAINVTNNGISLLPSFSLGKPAVMFDMVIGRKRLSFEPQFRFALEGKPWNFLFWWRYKLLRTSKWAINLGAHPAISFKERNYMVNGEQVNVMISQRVLAGEFSPNYNLSKNISLGMYYLYAHGLETDATKDIHFLALRSNFSNIKLSNLFYVKFVPQIYYLRLDNKDGFYVNSNLTLAKKNFPIAISSIMSKTIKTDIAGNDFVWNISLNYTFGKNYIGK
jgi:hypothetical protein